MGYIGNKSHIAKKITKLYVGSSAGKAQKVLKAYVGNAYNRAQLWWTNAGSRNGPTLDIAYMPNADIPDNPSYWFGYSIDRTIVKKIYFYANESSLYNHVTSLNLLTKYGAIDVDRRGKIKLYGYRSIGPGGQGDVQLTLFIVGDGSSAIKTNADSSRLFYYFRKLENFYGLKLLETCDTTNMGGMFQHCTMLTSLDLTAFDTRNATKMGGMFNQCIYLETINVTEDMWDTSNANTDMMFTNCGTDSVTYV